MSDSKNKLCARALHIRCETLKLHMRLQEIRISSCLSMVDLLTVLFLGGHIRVSDKDKSDTKRDRLIFSKGHGSLALYPILAELGFIDHSELEKIHTPDSILSSIPTPRIPLIETMNGALGHGLGVGCGMAVGMDRKKSSGRVIVFHGDGELNEGSVWEAVMFAGHHKISNIYLILDNNRRCMLGDCNDIISQMDVEARFRSFGWETFRCDGHDLDALEKSFAEMFASTSKMPKIMIADTRKGYGISELENNQLCHVMSVKPDRCKEILEAWQK